MTDKAATTRVCRARETVCRQAVAQRLCAMGVRPRRDGNRCVYCRDRAASMTVDHVLPVVAGIDHRPTNLVAACAACNTTKGVVDADLFCMHIARRTGEAWRTIWARVRAARRAPIGGVRP